MKKVSNIEERIINQLKLSDGATTKDIARSLSIGIATASKYLEVLHATEQIQQKRIGPSNYWTLPKSTEAIMSFEKFKDNLNLGSNGKLSFGDMHFVIFTFHYYTKLVESMAENFGHEKMNRILYSVAKESGIEIYNAVHSVTNTEGLPLLKGMLNFLKFLGYGEFELGEYNLSFGQLTIVHHPLLRDKLDFHPFISGILAGIISKVTGLKLECVETKCIIKGNSHCEYVTKPILIKKKGGKFDSYQRIMDYKLRKKR